MWANSRKSWFLSLFLPHHITHITSLSISFWREEINLSIKLYLNSFIFHHQEIIYYKIFGFASKVNRSKNLIFLFCGESATIGSGPPINLGFQPLFIAHMTSDMTEEIELFTGVKFSERITRAHFGCGILVISKLLEITKHNVPLKYLLWTLYFLKHNPGNYGSKIPTNYQTWLPKVRAVLHKVNISLPEVSDRKLVST